MSPEEHGQKTYALVFFFDVKPVNCAIDRQVPQSRQNIVVPYASIRRSQYAITGRTDFHYPRFGMLDRTLYTLAEAEIAFQKMVEYQPEIVFGFNRNLK